MLIDVEPLRQVVELVLQAQFIKPFEPTNLLLIAKPETGKTSILSTSQRKDFVFYVNEITAKMLIDIFFPLVERGEARTLVIPDFLNCVEKQKSTRQQFLMLLKTGIEEGFTQIQTYHKRYVAKSPIKFSLITAITRQDFGGTSHDGKHYGYRRYLEQTGLLSRFIPFSYDYPISKVHKILEFIENEGQGGEVALKTIKRSVEVPPNPTLFKSMEIISLKLGQQYSGYGFRVQEQLQRLAKARAVLKGRKELKAEDINAVIELANYMNFDFNPL